MAKVLFVATVVKTHIMVFHIPYLKMFKEAGWETAVAAKNDYLDSEECLIPYCDTFYDIPFERIPFNRTNLSCALRLKQIIDEGKFDIIHCHTPVGGVLTRLVANHTRKKGTKVIYTAHGFHFYKGAPIKNWLIYYPVEWLCAHWTDTLITINREDYDFAKKHMHAKRVEYVPGIGVDLKKFGCYTMNPEDKRNEIGVPADKVWLLSVGELIPRKNHETLIRAIADIPNVYLTIAGQGTLEAYLSSLIRGLNLENRVQMLGYRTDIAELCNSADIFCMPSFQEGLSVALMEAMACGKPCAVSNIRGNTDLIKEKKLLFDPYSVESTKVAIEFILQSDLKQLGKVNAEAIRGFDIESVLMEMNTIYSTEIAGDTLM